MIITQMVAELVKERTKSLKSLHRETEGYTSWTVPKSCA